MRKDENDAWTEKSEELHCDKCGSTIWGTVFEEGLILYGDCHLCEHQQVLINMNLPL